MRVATMRTTAVTIWAIIGTGFAFNAELSGGTPCGTGSGITIPGADASDGVFDPNATIEVDLSAATEVAPFGWEAASGSGSGIYDPGVWAVVFKYASVDIGPGEIVTFREHPSGAPVVWLVSGDVTIANNGVVNLDGENSFQFAPNRPAEPGPGGFRGGKGWASGSPPAGGHGPGGAGQDISDVLAGGAGFVTDGVGTLAGVAYGSDDLIPLIGGSGGAGHVQLRRGGAGGGAILIAAGGTITVNGRVTASGGDGNGEGASAASGGGSGGAIRLVADVVSGSGSLLAEAGSSVTNGGSVGRIRIESNCRDFADVGNPPYSDHPLGVPLVLFQTGSEPSITPTHFILEDLSEVTLPSDPTASFSFPEADAEFTEQGTVTLVIEAQGIPTDWIVNVRVVPRSGDTQCVQATLAGGDMTLSTWTADISAAFGFSALQVRADPSPINCN